MTGWYKTGRRRWVRRFFTRRMMIQIEEMRAHQKLHAKSTTSFLNREYEEKRWRWAKPSEVEDLIKAIKFDVVPGIYLKYETLTLRRHIETGDVNILTTKQTTGKDVADILSSTLRLIEAHGLLDSELPGITTKDEPTTHLIGRTTLPWH